MKPIVEAENISRFYGMVLGLNNVSFTIAPGITGIVGPNGAGKTTLFRLLNGQIKPSAGTIRVFGEDPWHNPAVQARLAFCPEGEAVPRGLRPLDWLTGLGMISGLKAAEARERSARALERVQLAPEHWGKRVSAYSKGMKQRVKLAQCLVHEPALIILDEPMNGLDPMGREEFANVLRDLAAGGTSVVISSHILHDLETLCAAFLLFRWGRIPRALNDAASSEARSRAPEATTFRCADPEKLARFLFERGLLAGCDVVEETGTLQARWKSPERFHAEFHEVLLASHVPIYEVQATASVLENAIEPAARQ